MGAVLSGSQMMQPRSGLDELGHEPRVETRPKTKTRFNPGLPNVGLAIDAIPLGWDTNMA